MRCRETWRRCLPGVAALCAALAACGDGAGPAAPHEPDSQVAALQVVSGAEQTVTAGRRSPEPVRVRATDAGGREVRGAMVEFTLSGEGTAILSQRRALTDADGVAETFLLEPRSGAVLLAASSGNGHVEVPLVIERAPGEIVFEAASGAVGLPGHPHPDSVVRVRLLDREGRPMSDREVWFAGHREVWPVRDTTDTDGWAGTTIRRSSLVETEGRVWAFLLDEPGVTASVPRPVAAPAARVILISIDGLRGDALDRHAPPTLQALAAEAASTTRARTVLPSLTTPAHLSLLSGVSPEAHGIFSEELSFTPAMAELEPLFLTVSRTDGARTRAFLTRGGPLAAFEIALQCRVAFGLDSLDLVEARWDRIAEAAEGALQDPDVQLTFIHVPDPERAGHAHGYESPEYGEAVLRADSAVARVLESVGPQDLLVITSDHGGGGAWGSHQNGSASAEDVEIPLIVHGPRVVATDLGSPSILDVAPTILWSLGLQVPREYEGRILLEGFR